MTYLDYEHQFPIGNRYARILNAKCNEAAEGACNSAATLVVSHAFPQLPFGIEIGFVGLKRVRHVSDKKWKLNEEY